MMAVLGNILNAETTQTRANSAPTYLKSAGGCGFFTTDPAATRIAVSR
jgi:hypothetical protein